MENTVFIYNNLRIPEMPFAIPRCRSIKRIRLLLGVFQPVLADGIAQLFVYAVVIQYEPGCIKSIMLLPVISDRTCTDGFLPIFVNPNGYGVMFPVLKVGTCTYTPLVPSQAVQRRMVPLVEQPIQIKCPVPEERDTVTHKLVSAYRGEILYVPFRLFFRIVFH